MIKKLICLLAFVFLYSCLNNEQLKEGWWKYGEGYHIEDVISFERFSIRNDTLFLRNIPKAILYRREGSMFGVTDRKIIIKDLISYNTGVYYQKGVSK